jgi:hypothetical protein
MEGSMKILDPRVRYFAAAVVAVTGAACAPIPAGTPLQSNAAATAPLVAIGDNWTYRVRDGFGGLERGSQQYRVTEAGNGRIQVAVSREGASVDEIQIYDREWNWLKHPATHLQSFDYSPAYPAFAFPLAPGKTWRQRLTATDPVSGRRFPLTVDGVAVGWERVKVPAGEFDAIKIKRTVFFDYLEFTVRGRSEILEYEWYVPAVKQAVRREASAMYLSYLYGKEGSSSFLHAVSRDGGGGPRFVRDEWLIWELVSYSVR